MREANKREEYSDEDFDEDYDERANMWRYDVATEEPSLLLEEKNKLCILHARAHVRVVYVQRNMPNLL